MFLSFHIGFLLILHINGDILYTGNDVHKQYIFSTVLNSVSREKCKHDKKMQTSKSKNVRGI